MGWVDSGRAWNGGHCPIFIGADAQGIEVNAVLVGAWLASEEARETAKSFAGKPCSYRFVVFGSMRRV
ncbi:hypothetical protein C3F00_022295 [Pseudomonas sp. MWU13-2860]|nr:hypothetical protein C3F00_022295 [Pseudomonas sp. MWU13-2860]